MSVSAIFPTSRTLIISPSLFIEREKVVCRIVCNKRRYCHSLPQMTRSKLS